jgi:hypothetical protein
MTIRYETRVVAFNHHTRAHGWNINTAIHAPGTFRFAKNIQYNIVFTCNTDQWIVNKDILFIFSNSHLFII